MILKRIFENVEIIKTNISLDADCNGITENSRRVKEGFIFCALKGERVDGNKYIDSALKSGAVCVVTDTEPEDNVPFVLVADARQVFPRLLSSFYSHPERSFKYAIAVTGTNGKTSTTVMLKSIFDAAGYKVGLIGTMKYLIGDKEYNSESDGNLLTTPDPENLYALLNIMREENTEVLIMEASSHALAMDKLGDIVFDCGIFTNLTQDHLNFHGTLENYRDAKSKLFKRSKIALINDDDPAAPYMKEAATGEVVSYSINDINSDFNATSIRYQGAVGVDYVFLKKELIFRVFVGIPGTFTVYNSLAAASCALLLGIDTDTISQGLRALDRVEGRVDRVDIDAPFSVIIDFAHTPDAMDNVLRTVRTFTKGRLITVFGCGGDRDRGKRPLMGALAVEKSDKVIVTSDNPRTENRNKIIEDIMEGIINPHISVETEPDRTLAIRRAMDIAEADDVVLLLGKGHEEYEIDENGKHPFSERAEVIKYHAIMKSEGRI
ncbi:MAG: UDP-N-acetylmuramoyl-L-alanyl-D-glutamate--2,6-diaminopimelate ligase [Clostridia bacterium]|nr:UDP-N-acetylmuramoyl-L-alanyl-D-glutamate--2,6-diaminopimelate ligase [Clostridia bacterium]